MKNKRLGVNIDHVATIRNARGEKYPNPLAAALLAEKSGADSITIHSYGYNQTPDEAVDAGILGITSINQNNIKIWNELEFIFIDATPDMIGNEYSIVSMSGIEVYSGVFSELLTKINVNSLSQGIYNVLIDTSLGRMNKRIYIP